jgi:thiol:disulfide interchange protein DsbC
MSVVLLALALACSAEQPTPVDAAGARILERLKAGRPDLDYSAPKPSALPGLYEVQVIGGPLLYVSGDGEHFLAGDLYAIGVGGFVNVAEQQRQVQRRELLAGVRTEDTILFSPENPKAIISVFTDVDCGYCRKLHQEMAELNRRGIAVRYLAFPRAGLGSESFRKLATAWCAKDRQDTLTRLKNGESIPENVCPGNPVAAQLALGEQVGVQGTPALVLADGTLIPGYRPAEQLARELGIE